jgi:predicted AAA+ superfamily ATPase
VASASFRFSPELGRLYENLVAISLRKREMEGELETYFWKGPREAEVDFVVKRGLRVDQLIQVSSNIDDPRTKEREVRALLKASQELKCENLVVLTESAEREEHTSWFGIKGNVQFVPLWKWLAGTSS